jgi:hypothetical protein
VQAGCWWGSESAADLGGCLLLLLLGVEVVVLLRDLPV